MKPKKIPISEFKTHCLQIIDKIAISKTPIIITKRDKEVAQLLPFEAKKKKFPFGFLKDKVEITGDIISPIDVKWDAEND